ncbi:MAG: DnaB-like helicase N-terminal domain-containing protein, partial [Anaerotardibacter sp.]
MQKENTKSNTVVFSPGSERNILSICLRNEESINDVEGADIYAEHFSVPAHKYIYMALLYLYQKQIKPEPMSIMEVISGREAKKSIEDIGGLEYLTILSETHVPASNLKIFIEKVRQAFTRRKLLDIANDVMDFVSSAQAETLNPSELVSYAEQQLNDVSIQVNRVDEVYKMGTHTEAVLEERAKTPSAVPGLEVGWVEYDRVTNGAQPGDLIVV